MITDRKKQHLEMLHEYRKKLRAEPKLRHLFFELTMSCNEHCRHCGSRCKEGESPFLPAETWMALLDEVKENFSPLPMICVTGGEPMLCRDIYDIMSHAHELGFSWGMTSNGTLITPQAAHMLREAGMNTISISIDGSEETHDSFRQRRGGFRLAVEAVRNLLREELDAVQVTTVVTRKNIDQLEELFELVKELDVDSWRVINIEPIGRALELDGYTLTPEEYRRMFSYIRQKRNEGYPVQYGCSHFLGLDFEREVRDWYFLCNAGVYTASVMANGDIAACLDIERRPETIQGNILRESFTDVWKNRFEIFRTPLSEKNRQCAECDMERFCGGGAYHSWNYDENRPMVCFRDILF